jgi:uncharacterized hydrophobic protein (TIGR00271 family)
MNQLTMELTPSAREELYRSILDSSHLDLEYVAMLAFAGLIALFGLLQNSVAVIIGAMLISPLMNPILAGALALVLGDWSLGRRAASVLAWSIGGVIALTWLVAWLTPLNQVTSEILARTNPNLLDMLIAVLAGLAGTLALRGGPVSMTIIPGVAIAVAVIPPLAVVGFSLSTRHGVMAWGGFLLFVTNLVSIMISAAVVFRVMGFAPRVDTEEEKVKFRGRMAVSVLLLAILAVPLVQTLRRAMTQYTLRSDVEGVVTHGFKTDHSTIADLTYNQVGKTFQVNATVHTTQYFGNAQIESVQDSLRRRFGPNSQLLVNQILVTQGGLSPEQISRFKDFISGGVAKPGAKEEPFDLKATQEKVAGYFQKQVDEALQGSSIRCTGAVQAMLGANSPVGLNLRLATPEPLEEQTVKLLASQLSAKITCPVELHGVVELKSPDYTLVVQLPGMRSDLDSSDRAKLTKLAEKLVTQPDLRLQAALSAEGTEVQTVKDSRLWREVEAILSRSRLKASQWSMQAASFPGTSPAEGPPTDAAPALRNAKDSGLKEMHGPVRCTVSVYQSF